MNARKKVAIIFIYLQNNLGDDLFLKNICLRYPSTDFYVMKSAVENKTFDGIGNLYFSEEMRRYFKEFDLPELSRKAKRFYAGFDACVVLGGSIFMQYDQWRSKLANFKRRTSLNENTYVIGANFGPYSDSKFLTEHASAFSQLKDVCFRDSFSAAFFPDLNNVRYAPDILFSYKHEAKQEKNRIAISVINVSWDGRPVNQLKRLKLHSNDYIEKIVELCSEISRRGMGITLLSFCSGQGDMNTAKAIEARCLLNGVTDIEICAYTGDVEPVLDELSSARAIIATRFHAMVLGFLFKKPVYPLIYDEKQLNILQDLNFYGSMSRIEDLKAVNAADVVSCLTDKECNNLSDELRLNIERAVKESEKQFAKLDEFLKEKNNI